MLKAFFRDSAVYGVAKALTGAITLLTLPIYTHALPPGQYGVIDMLASAAAVVHVSVALEIAQGVARYVNAPETSAFRRSYASTALWFTVAAYSLFVFCALPLAPQISGMLLATNRYASEVRVAILLAWTTGLFYLLQAILRFEGLAARFAIVTLVYSVVSVGVTVFLLLIVHLGLVGLLVGQAIAGLIAAALALWFARQAVGAEFDSARCREMLTFSVPLVPSGVGVMLCLYVDRYAIARIMSVADLGLYAVGARLAAIIPVTLTGFQFALSPLIYRHHQDPETPKHLAILFRWFLLISLSLVMFLGVFAGELVRLVAPPSYIGARQVVFLLGAALLVSGVYAFFPGLWIGKHTRAIALISLVSGLLNLVLNFVLIPLTGLIGAAIATLASALVAAGAHFFLGQKLYPVPFAWRRIATACVLASIGGLFGCVGSSESKFSLSWTLAHAVVWALLSGSAALVLIGARDLRAAWQSLSVFLRSLRAA